jgi:hypothetical protein
MHPINETHGPRTVAKDKDGYMKIKMVVKDADLYKQHKAQQDVLIS